MFYVTLLYVAMT